MTQSWFRKGLAVVGVPCAIAAGSGPAMAADKLAVDVSAGAMAATNPFLQPGNTTASESGYGQVIADYSAKGEISTLVVHGYARVEQYTRRYNRDDAYSLETNLKRRLSERVDLNLGASFRSNRSTPQDILFNQPGTGVLAPGAQATVGDVTTYGRFSRSTDIAGHAGLGIALGPRDRADVDVALSEYHADDPRLSDFRTATQNLHYSRQLSESTSVYGRVNVSEVNYLGRRDGDATIVTPTLGVQLGLSDTVSLAVDVGGAWSRIAQPLGGHSNTSALAFHGKLCSDRGTMKLCLDASRSSQPTALGRISTVTQVVGTYDRTLGKNDRLRLYASYSRTAESASVVLAQPSSFFGASAELFHQVGRRLFLFAAGNYADLYQSGVRLRANVQVRAGISYRFGSLS